MNIAIIGAGRIGSTFAFYFARGGHEVTLIARGSRLEALQRDGAIVAINGDRAPVKATAGLDATTAYDLVLVTVLAHQADALLPAIKASPAKHVMFMFNTFEKLDRLRDTVGATRFAFGFPTFTAIFIDGKLKSTVGTPGQSTFVSSEQWAAVFRTAGFPTVVEPDMEAFLRSHAAFVIPLMALSYLAFTRRAGITWAEAARHARALREAFDVVRQMGHAVTPMVVALVSRLPVTMVASIMWAFSRLPYAKELGSMGPGEVQSLIDGMTATAPGGTRAVLAIRP